MLDEDVIRTTSQCFSMKNRDAFYTGLIWNANFLNGTFMGMCDNKLPIVIVDDDETRWVRLSLKLLMNR